MEFQELEEQMAQAPLAMRNQLKMLLNYVSIAEGVLPQYKEHLSSSKTYREFFDAIYADDSQRFTHAWALWAKMASKSWPNRFEPFLKVENLKLKAAGLPIVLESGVVLAPAGSYDNIVNFLVYKRGAFNVEAADFVTSVGGTFTCADYDFVGIYGIYQYRGNVIFEEWQEEKAPEKSKSQL